jgi:hypothetical protein
LSLNLDKEYFASVERSDKETEEPLKYELSSDIVKYADLRNLNPSKQ